VRSAITPQTLSAKATYKVSILEPSPRLIGDITDALRSEDLIPSSRTGDIRLGALFYSEAQEPVVSIFFDQAGTQCVLSGSTYAAKGNLRSVLRDPIRRLVR